MDKLRAKLADGHAVFGCWVGLNATLSAELIAKAGYDFAIIDTQHSAVTGDSLLPLLQVMDRLTPTFVRVNWTESAQIMRALDLGAAGVVAPVVSTAEEAAIAARAVSYPPDGIRSFGPVRSYYSPSDGDRPLCFVMIETAEAMDNLDAIAATPGVDGLFVGPHDLSLGLGLGLAHEMTPPLRAAMQAILDAARRHGLIPGCAALGLDHARALMEMGYRFLAVGADLQFVMQGAAANLQVIRGWTDG